MILQSLEQLLRVAMFRVYLRCAQRREGGDTTWRQVPGKERGFHLSQATDSTGDERLLLAMVGGREIPVQQKAVPFGAGSRAYFPILLEI